MSDDFKNRIRQKVQDKRRTEEEARRAEEERKEQARAASRQRQQAVPPVLERIAALLESARQGLLDTGLSPKLQQRPRDDIPVVAVELSVPNGRANQRHFVRYEIGRDGEVIQFTAGVSEMGGDLPSARQWHRQPSSRIDPLDDAEDIEKRVEADTSALVGSLPSL